MNTKFYSQWLRLTAGLILLLAALAPVAPVYADSCVVTTDADSGAGSLRAKIADPVCETITFDGDYTIVLASPLTIDRSLTIDGAGHSVTVSGSSNIAIQVFVVNPDPTVNLYNLTVANGRNGDWGGGIYNSGTLNLTNVTLFGNWTMHCGGGIVNRGVLNVMNSTFSENIADFGSGGAICNWDGALYVTSSTFSDNSGVFGGGAVYNNVDATLHVTNSSFSGNASTDAAISNGGTATVTNSTISGNIGGGFENSGTATVMNTIVNNNTSSNCIDYQGTLTASNNLADDDNCGPGFVNSPSILLGPLADNGGPTQTMALLPGSAAIDAGDDTACPATDQRGVTRPQGAHCDIGAYEAEPATGDDTTSPTITLTTPAEGAVYLLGQSVNAVYACQDETGGSGLASCVGDVPNGNPIDTGSVGTKTFTVNAADNAGNPASVTHTYRVLYNFTGFFSPVDNPPTMNTAKAGQAIPLKWRITDANGNPVTTLTGVSVTAVSLSCPSAPTVDAIEEYVTSNSGLQNLGDGYYQWNWKSPTSYANTCKTLKLDLGEGTGFEHLALFQFSK